MKIKVLEVDKSLFLFIGIDNDSKVLGSCSFKIRKNNIIRFQDAYVEKTARGKGVYKKLFASRLKYVDINFPNYEIEAYCNFATKNLFIKNDFDMQESLFLMKKKSSLLKSHSELCGLLDDNNIKSSIELS